MFIQIPLIVHKYSPHSTDTIGHLGRHCFTLNLNGSLAQGKEGKTMKPIVITSHGFKYFDLYNLHGYTSSISM